MQPPSSARGRMGPIKPLDNGQQKSDSLAKARRRRGRNLYVDNNAKRGNGHDGQNQERIPREVEEQRFRPSCRGNEKTGRRCVEPSSVATRFSTEGKEKSEETRDLTTSASQPIEAAKIHIPSTQGLLQANKYSTQ